MKKINILALFLVIVSKVAFAECIDWPKVMTKYDIGNMPTNNTSIVVQQFDNFTKQPADSWLSFGIPYLFAEYLSTGQDLNVLQGVVSKYHSGAVKPKYIIQGMFQRLEGKLRVFVKLIQGADLIKQLQLDIPYPKNKQFFSMIADSSWAILGIIQPSYDKNRFEFIKIKTESMPAYENFIRGVMAYQEFNPDQMDVAKTWFDESIKNDVHYQDPYEGLVNVYNFLALYNKQYKKAYSGYYEKAEKTSLDAQNFIVRPPVPERPKKFVIKVEEKPFYLQNRFLNANSSFNAGLEAAGQKKWSEAARYFEEALALTPEDAITWYHLSQMREKAGNKSKAAEARKKAAELNSCLK